MMKPGDKELVIWVSVVLVLYVIWQIIGPDSAAAAPGPYAMPGGGVGPGWSPSSGVSPALVSSGAGPTTVNNFPGGSFSVVSPYEAPIPGFPAPTSMGQLMTYINQSFFTPGSGSGNYFPLFGFVGVDTTQSFQ